MANELELQNLLSAVTEALLADGDLDAIIGRYDVPRAEVEGFINIIRRLHVTMVGAQPSRRFVRRLRQNLVGDENPTVVYRIRHLPARVQIAAGIALVAGFMLFSQRRMIEDALKERREAPAL